VDGSDGVALGEPLDEFGADAGLEIDEPATFRAEGSSRRARRLPLLYRWQVDTRGAAARFGSEVVDGSDGTGGIEMPFDEKTVSRHASVKWAGGDAIEIGDVAAGDGAKTVDVEVGVLGFQRIEGPLDEMDTSTKGVFPLGEFELAANVAITMARKDGGHVGVEIRGVIVESDESLGETDHFVVFESAKNLAAGVIGNDVGDVRFGVEFGVGPDGSGDLDATVKVIEGVKGTNGDVGHKSFQWSVISYQFLVDGDQRRRSAMGRGGEFEEFGLVPKGFHLRPRNFGESSALFASEAFHAVETASEFGAGFFEGDFGIYVEESSEIDGDKQDVAEFRFDGGTRGRRGGVGEDGLEFVSLFGELGKDAVDVGPIESDAGSFARELEGFQECGESARNTIQDGGRGSRFLYNCLILFLGLSFLLLDLFPVAQDVGGGFGSGGAEDVGVAANHLLVDLADDVGNIEALLFMCDLRVEENLEEKVAELLGELGVIGRVERVEDLVSFFNKIRAEGGVGLLAVPGAAFRGAETRHDGD